MSIVNCKCGADVSIDAKFCPSCGAPNRAIRKHYKETYLASLTPEKIAAREAKKKELSSESYKELKKATVKALPFFLVGIVLLYGFAKINNYVPRHGKTTFKQALADSSGWTETMHSPSKYDTKAETCRKIKNNHRRVKDHPTSKNKAEALSLEKAWRQNKCKN